MSLGVFFVLPDTDQVEYEAMVAMGAASRPLFAYRTLQVVKMYGRELEKVGELCSPSNELIDTRLAQII